MPATQTVHARTLYRFVFRAAHNAATTRTCEQWHETYERAEASAKSIAVEWGGKRPMKVALVFPVPAMPHGLNLAAGSP